MELRAEELKIGNLVIDHSRKIHKINAKSILAQAQYEAAGFEGYGAIPLTEEILLKIEGVEKLDNIEWEYLLKISAAKLCFRFNAGHCYTQFNDTYLGDMISCLHELQNFCHVFKKELNLKL